MSTQATPAATAHWDRVFLFPLFALAMIGAAPFWIVIGNLLDQAGRVGQYSMVPYCLAHAAIPALIVSFFLSLAAWRFAQNMVWLGAAAVAVAINQFQSVAATDLGQSHPTPTLVAAVAGSLLGAVLVRCFVGRFLRYLPDAWFLYPLFLLHLLIAAVCLGFWAIRDLKENVWFGELDITVPLYLAMAIPPTLALSFGVAATALRFAPTLYRLLVGIAVILGVAISLLLYGLQSSEASTASPFVYISVAVGLGLLTAYFVRRYLGRFLLPPPPIEPDWSKPSTAGYRRFTAY